MPISGCYYSDWEDAFNKFGYDDGDGEVKTWDVAHVLEEAGYTVTVEEWGMHNTVISSVKQGDKEFIPHDNPKFEFGYDCPRHYLPGSIVELLDEAL